MARTGINTAVFLAGFHNAFRTHGKSNVAVLLA